VAKFSKDLFAEEKQKHYCSKARNGMKFRFSQELLLKAAAHAEERGMTLDEYIKEAAELAQEQQKNGQTQEDVNKNMD
jgi:hypothetical protein